VVAKDDHWCSKAAVVAVHQHHNCSETRTNYVKIILPTAKGAFGGQKLAPEPALSQPRKNKLRIRNAIQACDHLPRQ